MSIALAVIAGDDAIEQGFERMLKSVEGKVDGVFVSFNGEDQDVFFKLGEAINADIFSEGNVAEFPWQDDFSLARNHSFHLVSEHMRLHEDSDFDWIVWLDCDDVVPAETDFRAVVEIANERHAHGVWMPYHYRVDEATGVVQAEHYKERMFRTDVDWQWVYPIHENCVGPVATRMTKISEHPIKHLRKGAEEKRERNRRIVARWWRQDKTNPRAMQLMGHETFAEAEAAETDEETFELANASLKLYRDFLGDSEISDDSYTANLQVARLLVMLNKPNDAINIALQGIKMQPTWPGAYTMIAEIYHNIDHDDDAVKWARIARASCEVPETIGIFEPLDLDYRPLMIEGASLMKLGNYKDALRAFQDAHEFFADEFTKGRIRDAATELARERSDGLFGKQDIKALRDERWGFQSEKSIAFFTRPHFEKWDAGTLEKEGMGGTETCVIRLAQNLVKRGWRVVIFGTPTTEGSDSNGIEWYNSERWHPDEPFTTTVSVRTPQIFDANVKSKVRICWMHDVHVGDVRHEDGGDRFSPESVDVILAPSPWHIQHLARVYEFDRGSSIASLEVISNGFDREQFLPTGADRKLDKFVYASSPDRGLDRLLDFWPRIRKFYSEAELHVFYGWEAIDKIIEKGLPTAPMLAFFKHEMEAKLDMLGREDAGIFWHGRVPQRTLAHHLRGSTNKNIPGAGFMLYPANFMETFGLVFAQAMTAGCIPLTCDLGALPQMIDDPRLIVSGAAPGAEIYESLFLEKLVNLFAMTNGERSLIRDRISRRTASMTWDQVADSWEMLVGRLVERKDFELQVVQG